MGEHGTNTPLFWVPLLQRDEMDNRDLRWKDENGNTRKNELFVPKKSVNELISSMRTINGIEMYLFMNENGLKKRIERPRHFD